MCVTETHTYSGCKKIKTKEHYQLRAWRCASYPDCARWTGNKELADNAPCPCCRPTILQRVGEYLGFDVEENFSEYRLSSNLPDFDIMEEENSAKAKIYCTDMLRILSKRYEKHLASLHRAPTRLEKERQVRLTKALGFLPSREEIPYTVELLGEWEDRLTDLIELVLHHPGHKALWIAFRHRPLGRYSRARVKSRLRSN